MNLWNCSFSKLTDRNNLKEIEDLICPDLEINNIWNWNNNSWTWNIYTWTWYVYRAWFLWEDWAYYITQDLFFTLIIRFWSIFFVWFSIIALSIKSFKLWLKK